MSAARHALCGIFLLAACSEPTPAPAEGEVEVGDDGTSALVSFEVPDGARSVTVVVEGDPGAMFALASLRLADEVERMPPIDPSRLREEDGHLWGEGAVREWPRPATFVLTYPLLASQAVVPGTGTLRVASDRSGRARVRVYTPVGEADGLHVSFVSFSDAAPLDAEPAFVAPLRASFAAIGVELVVDEMIFGGARAPLALTAPTPGPTGSDAEILAAAQALLSTDALPVVLIDFADDFVFGMSRGLPVPPVRGHGYYGVLVDPTPDSGDDDVVFGGRIAAHEIGHALGLGHIDDAGVGGETIADPFDDTNGFDDTIMGSALTGGPLPAHSLRWSPMQVFAMTRSPLLR